MCFYQKKECAPIGHDTRITGFIQCASTLSIQYPFLLSFSITVIAKVFVVLCSVIRLNLAHPGSVRSQVRASVIPLFTTYLERLLFSLAHHFLNTEHPSFFLDVQFIRTCYYGTKLRAGMK